MIIVLLVMCEVFRHCVMAKYDPGLCLLIDNKIIFSYDTVVICRYLLFYPKQYLVRANLLLLLEITVSISSHCL